MISCRPGWPTTSVRMRSTRPDGGSRPTGIIKEVTPLQLSRLIATAAADKKARGIVRLDIRQKTSIADYFDLRRGHRPAGARHHRLGHRGGKGSGGAAPAD